MNNIVIKIGGEIIDNESYFSLFADECASICQSTDYRPIIVHGGGKQISAVSAHFGLEPKFENGLRITSEPEMKIVQMVLAGSVNSTVVRILSQRGMAAIGVSGISMALLRAEPLKATGQKVQAASGFTHDNDDDGTKDKDTETTVKKQLDLDENFTARDAVCDARILRLLLSDDLLPVISPVGLGPDGHSIYNINADTAAAAVASALDAPILFVTDVEGVLGVDGAPISQINRDDYQQLVTDGVVRGGMRAKLSACFDCGKSIGVKKAIIGMVQQKGDMLSLINHTQGTIVNNEPR